MFITNFIHSGRGAALAAVITLALLLGSFVVFEPIVGRAAEEIFTIQQTITAEISFYASTTAVTMVGSIAGVTGGEATGTAKAIVLTNNATGYNMTMAFASATAMYRDGGQGQIPNYSPTATSAPDFEFATETFGQFAYSILASTTGEVASYFKDDASDCATGSNETENRCWMAPSTTARTIINSTLATPTSGSTSTIKFKVHVPNSPSPTIPTGTYTATATLTAVTNP